MKQARRNLRAMARDCISDRGAKRTNRSAFPYPDDSASPSKWSLAAAIWISWRGGSGSTQSTIDKRGTAIREIRGAWVAQRDRDRKRDGRRWRLQRYVRTLDAILRKVATWWQSTIRGHVDFLSPKKTDSVRACGFRCWGNRSYRATGIDENVSIIEQPEGMMSLKSLNPWLAFYSNIHIDISVNQARMHRRFSTDHCYWSDMNYLAGFVKSKVVSERFGSNSYSRHSTPPFSLAVHASVFQCQFTKYIGLAKGRMSKLANKASQFAQSCYVYPAISSRYVNPPLPSQNFKG